MTEARCWLIVRKAKREPGIDTHPHYVDALEIEKIVNADINDHPRTVGRGSTILLKCGGVAYSHATPVEVAKDLGWR